MNTALSEKKLRFLVVESVKKALDSKFMKLSSLVLPHVSNKEQKEIERLYKRPTRKATKSYFTKV